MSFSSANPKVGDKFTIGETGEPKGMEATISAIEKAGKLELMAMPQQGFGEPEGPGGPDPEGFGGGPAFGIGPNGEFAKSKHPAFIAHTWKSDLFMSKGVEQQTATFGKAGALTITFDKGKPVKGKWEVAGPQITLTYPDPETGKDKAMVYRFFFGGAETTDDDGKTIATENLFLHGP